MRILWDRQESRERQAGLLPRSFGFLLPGVHKQPHLHSTCSAPRNTSVAGETDPECMKPRSEGVCLHSMTPTAICLFFLNVPSIFVLLLRAIMLNKASMY